MTGATGTSLRGTCESPASCRSFKSCRAARESGGIQFKPVRTNFLKRSVYLTIVSQCTAQKVPHRKDGMQILVRLGLSCGRAATFPPDRRKAARSPDYLNRFRAPCEMISTLLPRGELRFINRTAAARAHGRAFCSNPGVASLEYFCSE